jgi:leader peptidase (prepilin peptidase) / N-methyltransferase
MEIFLLIILGFIGAAVGSFINVCIDRLPSGGSVISPPSYCDSCYRRLHPLEMIPVFSYIILRGRCRKCGAKIPLRVMLVELFCGVLTAYLLWDKGLTADFAFSAFYCYIFVAIALIDLKHQLILNVIVYPSVIAGLIIAPFFLESVSGTLIMNFLNGLAAAGIGALILFIPFLATFGRGMGFGDVKMAVLIGLSTGFPNVLIAILGGIILGGVMAVILLAARIKKRKDVIPFGPFLSLASIVTVIWGDRILAWYTGIFTF